MKRLVLFLTSAMLSLAQLIPNRYIVEFLDDPTSRMAAQRGRRLVAGDPDLQARRRQLENEHVLAERIVRGLGGRVTHHFYAVTNGMAVTMSADAAARMAQTPGVRSVAPVVKHHLLMDQALTVHRVKQAWQTLSNGSSGAGDGIKIGILDTGVDASHPAFQGFSKDMPSGFPIKAGGATDDNVNNKVIVSRVYTDLEDGVDNTMSDGNDFFGHGTTVAGIAAGLQTDPKTPGIGLISGVAPGAWIGSYKIGDDFGDLSLTTFLAGLEDAMNDGMNVVNYSAGSQIYTSAQETGIEARAIANAVAAGMLVVVAAGNDGPGLGTISSPAATPAAIAVGGIQNQRWFWYAVIPSTGQPIYAIPPDEEVSFTIGDFKGPLVDVGTVASGGDTHACSALPADSLKSKVALIQRGSGDGTTCFFETKLNNAQNAGAVAAIVYDNTDRPYFDYTLPGSDLLLFQIAFDFPPVDASGNDRFVSWSVGGAALPGMLISKADGATLVQAAQSNSDLTVDLDFDGKTAMPYPSNQILEFSSIGPTPGANLKPDVVAVGDWLVAPVTTAVETGGCQKPFALDLTLGCYPPYTFLDSPFVLDFLFGLGFGVPWDDGAGTSFATPMVTGAVALLMSARPGLTAAQYRSLVTNSSAEFDNFQGSSIVGPKSAGGGILDVLGALQQGLTAAPSTLNFRQSSSSGGSSSSSATSSVRPRDDNAASAGISQTVNITNIGTGSDTFTVTFNSIDGVATPAADSSSFTLNAGASKTLTLTLPSSLASGEYHGFMLVTGTQGQTPLRVPYWYGIAGTTAKNIDLLFAPSSDPSTCDDVIDFRLLDAVGLPVTPATDPTINTTATRAQVVSVTAIGNIPGTYEAEVVTGRPDENGNNVFTISADNKQWQIAIGIDNSGFTSCGGFAAMSASKNKPKIRAKAHGKKSPVQ